MNPVENQSVYRFGHSFKLQRRIEHLFERYPLIYVCFYQNYLPGPLYYNSSNLLVIRSDFAQNLNLMNY